MEKSGFIPVNGGRLYYEEAGDGPPLVLLHAGVANLRQWDPHVPAFAERYRVIRYDSRGYGQSESEHVEFSNHGDLEQVLDHLGVPATHLLGTSRSASIALNFTVSHPERVTSLIEVAGGGVGEPDLTEEEAALGDAMDKASEEALEAKDWKRLADLETAFWGDGPGQPEGRLEASIRDRLYDWILHHLRRREGGGHPPAARSAGRRTGRPGDDAAAGGHRLPRRGVHQRHLPDPGRDRARRPPRGLRGRRPHAQPRAARALHQAGLDFLASRPRSPSRPRIGQSWAVGGRSWVKPARRS